MIQVGCEESQKVCKAFRDRGYEAYSCDLKDTRGNPDWHYKQDVMEVIQLRQWDLIILHPDCTALSLSGNKHYGLGMPKNHQRLAAIDWTIDLWELAKKYSKRVCLENPTSVIFKRLDKDMVQYIQPWQFGHGETKKTGLALHNLPPLVPTNVVEGRDDRIHKMPPGPNRKRDRSETYQGIADAMADQWGRLL